MKLDRLSHWVLTGCLAFPAVAFGEGMVRDLFPEQAWTFEVSLDRKPIGFHHFRVQDTENGQRVEINADFDVKILFINAFSYEHSNIETWAEDCLSGLESNTTINGDAQTLKAIDDGDTFVVNQDGSESSLQRDCVKSFAYWRPSILEAEALLNSQTGELTRIDVRQMDDETLDVDGRKVDCTRWVISIPEGDINLWYEKNTQLWVALEAPAKGGRTLRYRPVTLPGEPNQPPQFGLN